MALIGALAVSIVAVPAAKAGVDPAGGNYADADVASTTSTLSFRVNSAGTRIKPDGSLEGGFPCAPKTVFMGKKIVIAGTGFSARTPMETTNGKPRGTLRWSGTWSSDDRVGGRLRMKDGDCSSAPVDWEASLPPGVPVAPTAEATSLGSVALDWPAVAGADDYVVGRSTAPGGPYTDLTTTADTDFFDSTGSPSTTYYYAVSAQNPAGRSAPGPESQATTAGACTDSDADAAPGTNLGSIDGDGSNAGPIVINQAICPGDQDHFYVQVVDGGGIENDSVGVQITVSMNSVHPLEDGNLSLSANCHQVNQPPFRSSDLAGTASETVTISSYENVGVDDTHFLFIHVAGSAIGSANAYTLSILGDQGDLQDRTCGADV